MHSHAVSPLQTVSQYQGAVTFGPGTGCTGTTCTASGLSLLQATLEWENQEDGFLAKILVGDGSKDIPVGTPVAVITEEKGDVSLLCVRLNSDACQFQSVTSCWT